MEIVDQKVQSVSIVPTERLNAMKHIEVCGRICYQSDKRITPDSSIKFVSGLFKSGHHAMIEMTNAVYMIKNPYLDRKETNLLNMLIRVMVDSPFIEVKWDKEQDGWFLAGNWRAWVDRLNYQDKLDFFLSMPNSCADVLQNKLREITQSNIRVSICHDYEVPLEMVRVTAILLIDRAVSHEIVRHRPASFAQESQRYCAYRKHVQFILPYLFKREKKTLQKLAWRVYCFLTEKLYKSFMKFGKMKPQEARAILPNCTATQIAITATVPEWNHIFFLRTAPDAYPPMIEIMKEVEHAFISMALKDKSTY